MNLTWLALTLIHQDGLPCVNTSATDTCHNGTNAWPTILAILFSFTGVISLLMLVVAGLRYTTSSGDPQELAKARRQILYTTIGLIVSLMAAVLVTFVLWSVKI